MRMLKPLFDSRTDHFSGSVTASIELVQYGDFYCNNCETVYSEIKLLQEIMVSRLKFVFRHFPLPNIHPVSLEAAIAAEAAALQQKFWHMHDIIFENRQYLTRSALFSFAKEIELDMELYEASREHKKVFQKVINDFESGVKSGVNMTPAFFINGLRYNGSNDFDSLYKECNYLLTLKNMELNFINNLNFIYKQSKENL
jgi:protein-disulfide isomerase